MAVAVSPPAAAIWWARLRGIRGSQSHWAGLGAGMSRDPVAVAAVIRVTTAAAVGPAQYHKPGGHPQQRSFLVFAPTNAAFSKLPASDELKTNSSLLTSALFHVVASASPANVVGTRQALRGASVTVTVGISRSVTDVAPTRRCT